MNITMLEKLGFTNGEIRVYSALLRLGESSSGSIIVKSKVSRSKVYEILERLKEKGLVSECTRSGVKHFQPLSPKRILDYIHRKEKILMKQKEDFKEVLPTLMQLQKENEEEQELKAYVGIEGIKTYFEDTLNNLDENNEYLAMTFSEKSWQSKSLSLLFKKFHQQRAEKGIKAKVITNDKNLESQKHVNLSETGLYEFKTVDVVLPTGIAISGDCVATFVWGKSPRIFSILCKNNAEQYRKFFYDLWNKGN
jgi:sugar-specific transcriptional regulator TrmB